LENLAAGSYELIVSTPGPGSSEVMKKKMRLAENQVLRNVVVRPEPQGGLTISGRVITPDGGALYGATVGIPGEYPLRTERVESDGRFVVKGLQEQAYTLVASCAGYSPVAVENVEAGTQNLTLKLVRPAVLAGNVTDATTGKPVTVFQLNAFTEPRVESDTITWNVVQTLSNEQGRFDFKNFAAMAVRLFVGAEGYAPWEQTVTLEEGKTSDIAVQLEPGAVVRGAVTDAQGNPVAGAEIMVAPGGAINAFLDPHLARSDANGAFETRALPEGAALKLIAKHPSYARDCVEVVPARANDTEVTFTLQQPGGLEIHALLDGEPMSRCYVQIHGACGPEAYLPQDPTGLVVQGLPPGELEFTAILYPENRAVQQQTLTATVVAGQTTPVEVNFKSPENDAP
jgi:hypothetical protein